MTEIRRPKAIEIERVLLAIDHVGIIFRNALIRDRNPLVAHALINYCYIS